MVQKQTRLSWRRLKTGHHRKWSNPIRYTSEKEWRKLRELWYNYKKSLFTLWDSQKEERKALLQGGHTEGPETYQRMLSITSHQSQNCHHKQVNKQQVLARLWRKGNPCTVLVGIQTGAATVENSMEFPQKTKNGTALWPSKSAAGIIP